MIVSIIVPTYNQEKFTVKCFESIYKHTKNYKIFWVDNGSAKESRQTVSDFIDKNKITIEKIFLPENIGFVKGVNKGLKAALKEKSEFFVIQNNDTEVYPGWLETMIKAAKSDKNIGMVGPISNSAAWQTPEHLGKFINELSNIPSYDNRPADYAAKVRKLYGDKYFVSQKVRMLSFFSTLIKKDVVEKVGLLSEEFGVGFGDDDDYGQRVKKAGFDIAVTPGVFVFHNHKTTFKSIYSEEEIQKMQDKNLEVYRNKHGLYGKKAAYRHRVKKLLNRIKHD